MKRRMVEYISNDSPYRLEEKSTRWEKSIGHQVEGDSPDMEGKLRSLKAEIRSCKVYNE